MGWLAGESVRNVSAGSVRGVRLPMGDGRRETGAGDGRAEAESGGRGRTVTALAARRAFWPGEGRVRERYKERRIAHTMRAPLNE